MKLFYYLALLAVISDAGKAKKAAKKNSASNDVATEDTDSAEIEEPKKTGKWAKKQEKKKGKADSSDESAPDEPGCVKKGKCDKGNKAKKVKGEVEKEVVEEAAEEEAVEEEAVEEKEVDTELSQPDSERNIGAIFSHLLGQGDTNDDKKETVKTTKKPKTTQAPTKKPKNTTSPTKKPKKTTTATTAKESKKPGKWAGKWNKEKGKGNKKEVKESTTIAPITTTSTTTTTTSPDETTVTTIPTTTEGVTVEINAVIEPESSDNDTRTVDDADTIIEETVEEVAPPPKPTTMWDVFRRIKENLPPLIPTTQPELTTYVPYGNEAREFFHAILDSDDVAMPCINGEHQCNEHATCYPDPLSVEGYACKCRAGLKGHGKKNLPVVWSTDVEPSNEIFWTTFAEQVSLVPELTTAFGLNDENSRTISDIADRVKSMAVPGRKGTNEEGLWFLKDSMVFNAGEVQGCVNIDECAEENKPVNANKPRLCQHTQQCLDKDPVEKYDEETKEYGPLYECETDFTKFCALGLHNCHALADCLPAFDQEDPTNSTGIYCQCKSGFTSAKGTAHVDDQCLDINECEEYGLDLCPGADLRCFNTIGSYKCVARNPTSHPDDFDLYPIYTPIENVTPTARPTTLPDTLPLCDQQDPLVIQLQAEQEQLQIATNYWNNQKDKANQRGIGGFIDEPCQDDTCGYNGHCIPRSLSTPWESLCICDAGFSGLRCEINLMSGGAAAGARYGGAKTCQEIKVYPGDKGTIEIFAKNNDLYDIACFRFITRPSSNTALHFRFGNDGGCAYNPDLPKCARYQSYWLALDNGVDEVDTKRLIEYQSEAWKWICESDHDPHFLGGHTHFIEKERSSITLIYQPTAMSVMREAVRLDYEADIDECTLGIHECHVEANCFNKLKGDPTYDYRGLNILSEEIASTLLNMRGVKYDFYRDEVIPKQEEEEEKAKVQNDAIAEMETDSKGFLEGNTQSINQAESTSAAANQTYEEKIAELSGTFTIIGGMIDSWGNDTVSQRESALANLLGLAGATRKRRQTYPEDPAEQLEYHNEIKVDMFAIAEAKLEGVQGEIILVSPEVLEHEAAMNNLLTEIDETKLWLAEKFLDRQTTQLIPLETNMNSYVAQTNEFIANITSGDVFSGDLIQNNVRLGSKPQSIRLDNVFTAEGISQQRAMLSGNWLCQVPGTYLVTFDVKLNPSTTANIELYVDNVGTGFGIEVNDLTRSGTDLFSQTAILNLNVGQEVSLMNHAGAITGGEITIVSLHN
ncbi:Oidioi.mRNA.OKI2018_I69.chr2.g6137.t1.cds [Oikopleura dioica]|uniref:Oidioi.mRNA.OKI2018_I69.chr2.g6137.t1.cds n=1 Tax=Oikopleura dioica TaxID=34765 RepID=A0ABN7T2M3_OIKDI|nr:Oidioi.mRNA.OKI2018_I69.chr2.g6137.t1.cds [Oikopleura dioica]